MEKIFKIFAVCCITALLFSCSDDDPVVTSGGEFQPKYSESRAEQNLLRAMDILDAALDGYIDLSGSLKLSRWYNPQTGTPSERLVSVWEYTGAMEAVNAVMSALEAYKSVNSTYYDQNYNRYVEWQKELYEGLQFYRGTFQLISFTQTKEWSVYGVNRGAGVGDAEVTGVMNVYDDQEWLVRELYEAYHLTGDNVYLKEAEYLAEYVLDGWDCTLDSNGNEYGGIPWGPGYNSMHACSNGPFISPLVWLHEHYKGTGETVTYRYIGANSQRLTTTMTKEDYYLMFAKKVYDYQRDMMYIESNGVYGDMRGSTIGNDTPYETVGGVRYRAHAPLGGLDHTAISYNSGTMLSGAADLYRVTGDPVYLDHMRALTDDSFSYFASLNDNGTYNYKIIGEFDAWYNNVLYRGWVDVYPYYNGAADAINSFQANLDYAYDNFVLNGFLPTNLLVGWNRDAGKNDTETLTTFSFAAEYATLAKYELEK